MRIVILAVGRMKSGPERELLSRYIERAAASGRGLGVGSVDILEVDESRARRADLRKRDEAAALAARVPEGASVVLLDEHGAGLDSAAFAALIASPRDAGVPAVVFIVGGADGLDPTWRAAGRAVAFGAMTLPHQLVRVLLAEQIYRACTILAGHPYHRA